MAALGLTLREVILRHGRHRALGPLSLEVRPGEVWGILGANGAGKSTLLAGVAGLLRPAAGSLRLSRPDGSTPRRREVGLVHQRHPEPPPLPLSVRDMVLLGRTAARGLGRRPRRDDLERVDEAARLLELEPLLNRPFATLSGGQRCKVHLARVLVQEAGLLLLDEPATGLDLAWQLRLVRLLDRLHAARPATMMVVVHDPAHLPASTTHLLLLEDGALRAAGPVEEVLAGGVLEELYGTPVEVLRRRGRIHVLPRDGGPPDAGD